MTIATLMATSAIFLVKGWTAPAFGALAITIGGVVCIAASNAGDTSQDLKTGYLVGSTPWKQQVALMFGVIVSIFSIGVTLNPMNTGFSSFDAAPSRRASRNAPGVSNQSDASPARARFASSERGQTGRPSIHNDRSTSCSTPSAPPSCRTASTSTTPPPARIEVQWIQGIGSEKAAAPQGRLMATVINGILSRKLPWTLVLLGVALVIVVELLGIRSLTFAVGAYLSIATTLAIFVGGVMRWMVDRALIQQAERTRLATNPDVTNPDVSIPIPACLSLPASLPRSTAKARSRPAASTPPASSPLAASWACSASPRAWPRASPSSAAVTGSSSASAMKIRCTTIGSPSRCSPCLPSASITSPANPSTSPSLRQSRLGYSFSQTPKVVILD